MNSNFKIIEGGLPPREKWPRYFISAYITNTRLMGTVGMYIHWKATHKEKDETITSDFHQFFYFETGNGLVTYMGLWSDDEFDVDLVEEEVIGNLGGNKEEITLDAVRHILKYYCEFNLTHHLPLPEDQEEYLDLILNLEPLPRAEQHKLLKLQCAEIDHEFQLINYFLMCSFGKDFEGASLLTLDGRASDFNSKIGPATLCKNTITPRDGLFICDSLIEYDDQYEIIITEIRIIDSKIQMCRKTSELKVSSDEASFILSRPEYITLYSVKENELDKDIDIVETFSLDFDSATDICDQGKLFFSFSKNDEHVKKKTFMYSGDIEGVYYLSNYDQFIIMSYDHDSIRDLEKGIEESDMSDVFKLVQRYKFKEPVMYDFIQSDFHDFKAFVDTFKTE